MPFETTAELDDYDLAVGQKRVVEALELAARIPYDGFNLFVLGPPGSHRHKIAEEFLRAEAARKQPPEDWCYLNNFADERKPIAVSLPPSRGRELREDMARLVERLRAAIPAAFQSERYANSTAEIDQELEDRHRAALEALQQEASRESLSLVRTPHGFAVAPVREGKVLADDAFEKLPEEEKKRTTEAIERLSDKLRRHIETLPKWQLERVDRIKALNREVTERAAAGPIEELEAKYAGFAEIASYLAALRLDVLANAQLFRAAEAVPPGAAAQLPAPAAAGAPGPWSRYAVNLLVDHADENGAPVVYENNPSLPNLLGRIEHVAQLGALVTDYSLIRPGALHRANGGYLILDADRLLAEPLAWNALKRALFAKEIRIEEVGRMLSLISTVSLEPEPIPLDTKIALIGERLVYYLLCELDPDFGALFKVAADFENRIDRSRENTELYARLIATLARRERLLPLTRAAVARVIEQSARLIGDSEKLSSRLRDVVDLMQEAAFRAAQSKAQAIDRPHVQQAIDAQTERVDRVRDEFQEEIERNDLLIDTSGAVVGQVNGLSVLTIGSFSFGQPTRITANARMGDGEVVDIERETELGGAIHSKGVLILSAYLGSRYAPEVPLSMSASLVFEQSYGGVEGDSASVAESCALLSALAGLPIKQSLAVTGSMNQHGVVQVIGGVNEKIEGFFDACARRGLTGEHGVLIPKDNVKHLMLRDDVVEAVREGRFRVYPITTIDDAIALLTGVPAGVRNGRGRFPKGSVNQLVEARLTEFAHKREEVTQQILEKARRSARKKK
ncbi:MAG TPA: ATP-binding protein [Gammaproteobacteria bacterium]|nr:ATP-binding protein [Gammaproteobacteria bacterium]